MVGRMLAVRLCCCPTPSGAVVANNHTWQEVYVLQSNIMSVCIAVLCSARQACTQAVAEVWVCSYQLTLSMADKIATTPCSSAPAAAWACVNPSVPYCTPYCCCCVYHRLLRRSRLLRAASIPSAMMAPSCSSSNSSRNLGQVSSSPGSVQAALAAAWSKMNSRNISSTGSSTPLMVMQPVTAVWQQHQGR